MNQYCSFSIIGLFHPLGKKPSFYTPLLSDGKEMFIQKIRDNEIIEEFISFNILESESIVHIKHKKQLKIGDDAIYAFCFNGSDYICENKTELRKILESRFIDLMNYPFIKLEVLRFLGKDEAISWAINDAADELSKFNSDIANAWKIRELYNIKKWEQVDINLGLLKDAIDDSLKPDISKPITPAHFSPSNRLVSLLDKLTKWYSIDETKRVDLLQHFVSHIWEIEHQQLPTRTRRQLIKLLGIVPSYLERTLYQLQTSKEIGRIFTAIAFANILISKLRKVGGRQTIYNLVYNLSNTLPMADRAGFFKGDSKYIGQLMHELVSISDSLKTGLNDSSSSITIPREYWRANDKFRFLINCADICRFRAKIAFEHMNLPNEALDWLNLTNKYYDLGRKCSHVEIASFNPFINARALILRGQILMRQGKDGEGLQAFDEAIKEVQAGKSDSNKKIPTTKAILEIDILLEKARFFPDNTKLKSEIALALDDLLQKFPDSYRVRKILISYYTDLERDVIKIIDLIDAWITRDITQASKNSNYVQWLIYLAARICEIAFLEDDSYADLAITRYGDVLHSQTTNTRATANLINILAELSDTKRKSVAKILEHKLISINDDNCPLMHLVIHIALGNVRETVQLASNSLTQALMLLVQGKNNALSNLERDYKIISENGTNEKLTLFALELLSKWYFNLGKKDCSLAFLKIALRILDDSMSLLSLSGIRGTQKDKLIWSTRKLEILLLQGKLNDAYSLNKDLLSEYPDDSILKIKMSIVLIRTNDFKQAREMLESIPDTFNGVRSDANIAKIDRLAYLDLRDGNFIEAASAYTKLIERNALDHVAHFGLGQVFFEQGEKYWPQAFDEWLFSLRLRLNNDSAHDQNLSWLTGRSIVTLFNNHKNLSSTVSDLLFSQLGQTISYDNERVSGVLINSLSSLGIVDPKITSTILNAPRQIMNITLLRHIAKYLMTYTIHFILENKNSEENKNKVQKYVTWCSDNNVLPEYLAGAKGAYGRALLRFSFQGRVDSKSYVPENTSNYEEFDDPLFQRLFRHISTFSHSKEYYHVAADLTRSITKYNLEKIAIFVESMIHRIISKLQAETPDLESLIQISSPSISLCSLNDLISLDKISSTIPVAWIDSDYLKIIEQTNGPASWTNKGSTLVRPVRCLPEEEDRFFYNKAGIFFEARPSEGKAHNYHYYYQCRIANLPTQFG